MGFDIVGTPKSATVDGISYDVQTDADIKQNNSKYDSEGVATSGRIMQKMIRRIQSAEGVTLATNAEEDETLRARADTPGKYPLSYTTIDGTVYRTTGFIKYEGRSTATGTTTIQMIPTDQDGWKVFILN